jgi:hypothetical protein
VFRITNTIQISLLFLFEAKNINVVFILTISSEKKTKKNRRWITPELNDA